MYVYEYYSLIDPGQSQFIKTLLPPSSSTRVLVIFHGPIPY